MSENHCKQSPVNRKLLSRIFSKIKVNSVNKCWEWQAYINDRGYGEVSFFGKKRSAYKVIYELFCEPVPSNLELDHLCRNTQCVNPAHLEPVTHKENILRGNSPNAVNAAKTHCKHGHLLDGENLFFHNGFRQCRACSRNFAMQRYNAEKLKKPVRNPDFCQRGHEFTPENTGKQKQNYRYCKQCRKDKRKKHF